MIVGDEIGFDVLKMDVYILLIDNVLEEIGEFKQWQWENNFDVV